ncbi:hypothetical protein PCE1_004150 [Barthelona sp. PCE]
MHYSFLKRTLLVVFILGFTFVFCDPTTYRSLTDHYTQLIQLRDYPMGFHANTSFELTVSGVDINVFHYFTFNNSDNTWIFVQTYNEPFTLSTIGFFGLSTNTRGNVLVSVDTCSGSCSPITGSGTSTIGKSQITSQTVVLTFPQYTAQAPATNITYSVYRCSDAVSTTAAASIQCDRKAEISTLETKVDGLSRHSTELLYGMACDDYNRCHYFDLVKVSTLMFDTISLYCLYGTGGVVILIIIVFLWINCVNISHRRKIRNDPDDFIIRAKSTLLAYREVDTLENVVGVAKPRVFTVTIWPLIWFFLGDVVAFAGLFLTAYTLGDDEIYVILSYTALFVFANFVFIIIVKSRASTIYVLTEKQAMIIMYTFTRDINVTALPLTWLRRARFRFNTLLFQSALIKEKKGKRLIKWNTVMKFSTISNKEFVKKSLHKMGYKEYFDEEKQENFFVYRFDHERKEKQD